MALSGTLGDFSLADILQLIGLQRKSGVLELVRDEERVELGFDKGRIVSAESSSRPVEQRVGTLLVRIGKLTETRLEQALKIQKQTLQRLGHVVVAEGWVDAESIRHQLVLQITETVYELFRWRSGEYDFRPDHAVEWDEQFIDPIPCEHLMMEGARMVDEWPMIERVIPSSSTVLRPTVEGAQMIATAANPLEAQGSIYDEDIDFELIPSDPLEQEIAGPRLGRFERHVLRWVDGTRTVAEIADLTELGRFDACKTLARLVELKLIELDRDAPVKGGGPAGFSLMRSELPARALAVVIAGLALAGSAATAWQLIGLVWTSKPEAVLPATATSTEFLAHSVGLDRAALLTDRARRASIERARQVSFLHSGSWTGSLDRLVEQELVPKRSTVDPWGSPYRISTPGSAIDFEHRGRQASRGGDRPGVTLAITSVSP